MWAILTRFKTLVPSEQSQHREGETSPKLPAFLHAPLYVCVCECAYTCVSQCIHVHRCECMWGPYVVSQLPSTFEAESLLGLKRHQGG